MLDRTERYYGYVVGGLLVLFISLEAINGRLWMNDLRVYFEAARAYLSSEKVYGITFGLGSGYYKYAPPTLPFFVPYACLPFGFSQILHFILIGTCAIGSMMISARLVTGNAHKGIILWLATFIIGVHWHRELHLGNINLLLLFVLLLSYLGMVRKKLPLAGIGLGVTLLFKPHFLIILPLITLYRQWKLLLYTVAAVAGISMAFAALNMGQIMDLVGGWIDIVRGHNAELIYVGGDSKQAVNTIYTVMHTLFNCVYPFTPVTGQAMLTLLIVALPIGIWLLRNSLRVRSNSEFQVFLWMWTIALVPSLTLTDTNHFLFCGPLIVWVLSRWNDQQMSSLLKLLTGTALFLIGGNWADLWGECSTWMSDHSFLGIGNLLLLSTSWALNYRIIAVSKG